MNLPRAAGIATPGVLLLALALAALAVAPAGVGAQTTLNAPPLPPAIPASGEVFRSVDENGTPTFSQTPPAGRASRAVELKPLAGSVDSTRVPAPVRPAAEPARAAPPAEPERPRAAPAPRGMEFETYIRIRRGMSEGELLTRAGPPDYRGDEVNRGLLQESWYYLPTSTDPFTTIIQLRGGRVVDTERIRKL